MARERTVQAFVFTANGGPEVEQLTDRPRPEPGPGQLLVAVHAAGVNPADWKRRSGFRRPGMPEPVFPTVFGAEAAGVVEAVGAGDTGGLVPGDAVFGSPVTGGYAEYTLIPADTAAPKPAALSFTDAATLPVAAATAWDGIRQLALPPGATLLVTGAGGGVGVAAVQIAVHEGLTVIGTASPGKKDLVEALGARHVAPGPGIQDRVRALAPGGVDAIFDLVGGDALREVAGVLADRTKLVSGGDAQTATELGGAPVDRARNRAVLEAVARLAVDGVLVPQVTATFPLDRAADALREVEAGHARGKIVIVVRGG
jgi:NADPH:quinone reductase-like Zn-dependent oxidoreductase